jgi:DNA-binding NtrC family response regulator
VALALAQDIDVAARSSAKVLITGETGAGKEVVARLSHERSARQAQPFVTINCAGMPETLLEAEFFGTAKGSFTDAYRDTPGLLRQADRGTVFLDEVGDMSIRLQGLLLRFLETGEIQTVGGGVTKAPVDVRVMAATNRDLRAATAAREFREDLYYRLNVLHIHVPPLRDRPADVPLLLDHFGRDFADQHGLELPVWSRATLDLLSTYAWPGNIRELRNVVERVLARAHGGDIEPEHLPAALRRTDTAGQPAATHPGAPVLSHPVRVAGLVERMLVHHESFWTTAYASFMSRDITREDMRYIVGTGLEQTHGSYRVLLGLFNMPSDDYKRFLGFLKQHACHLPFHSFRAQHQRPAADPGAAAQTA